MPNLTIGQALPSKSVDGGKANGSSRRSLPLLPPVTPRGRANPLLDFNNKFATYEWVDRLESQQSDKREIGYSQLTLCCRAGWLRLRGDDWKLYVMTQFDEKNVRICE